MSIMSTADVALDVNLRCDS